MSLQTRGPYGYTRMESCWDDPEEKKHRKAQFLIQKVLAQADSQTTRQRSSRSSRLRRTRVKVGTRLKTSRKRVMLMISKARAALLRQILKQLRILEALVWPCRD